ncbi:hypothetical protein [Leyella stercorea]|uniref:hypothetical protein n=1 Tax=Leyella stercorea TaxID=363265 RepID=UPI0026DB22C1|nr:hypothetical protein [Leyella stercorea]
MTREETAERIKIMQAYVDGKRIQYAEDDTDVWHNIDEPDWYSNYEYRIKPEPEYRPFKDADECWQEMLKHEPFGWVRNKFNHNGVIATIICLDSRKEFRIHTNFNHGNTSEDMINSFIFADGAPFGVKEEA